MESVRAHRVLLNDSIDWPRTGVFARGDTIVGYRSIDLIVIARGMVAHECR